MSNTNQNVKYTSFEHLLEKYGSFVYTSVGFSMMPLIRERRDLIEIKKKTSERYQKYQVILYRRENQLILHRILKVLPEGKYITAGDHNTFKEYNVTHDMILGVMTRVIRNGQSIYPSNPLYKLYYHLWVDFYPIRIFILRVKAILRSCINKLKKAVNIVFS